MLSSFETIVSSIELGCASKTTSRRLYFYIIDGTNLRLFRNYNFGYTEWWCPDNIDALRISGYSDIDIAPRSDFLISIKEKIKL